MVSVDRINTVGAAIVSLLCHLLLGIALAWTWSPSISMPMLSEHKVLQTDMLVLQHSKPPPIPNPTLPDPPIPEAEPTPALESKSVQTEQAEWAKKRIEDRAKKEKAQKEQEKRLREQQLKAQREKEEQQEERRKQQQIQEQTRILAEQERLEQARIQAERWAKNNHGYSALNKPIPSYPERALERGIEGDCVVEYTINQKGLVEDPRVLDQCHPLLIKPSLNAALSFQYRPQRVDGVPQRVKGVRNTFHFRIQGVQ